jgi:hypothetical protein
MLGKMKLVILALAISSIFTMKINSSQENVDSSRTDQLVVYDVYPDCWPSICPYYYSVSPLVYSDVYSYTYVDYFYSDFFIFRSESGAPVKQKFNKEKAAKELSSLKKEIWGTESFNTAEVRKTQKVYDPRWLLAQLKISKALTLEDAIKNGGKNLRSDSEDSEESDRKLIEEKTKAKKAEEEKKEKEKKDKLVAAPKPVGPAPSVWRENTDEVEETNRSETDTEVETEFDSEGKPHQKKQTATPLTKKEKKKQAATPAPKKEKKKQAATPAPKVLAKGTHGAGPKVEAIPTKPKREGDSEDSEDLEAERSENDSEEVEAERSETENENEVDSEKPKRNKKNTKKNVEKKPATF